MMKPGLHQLKPEFDNHQKKRKELAKAVTDLVQNLESQSQLSPKDVKLIQKAVENKSLSSLENALRNSINEHPNLQGNSELIGFLNQAQKLQLEENRLMKTIEEESIDANLVVTTRSPNTQTGYGKKYHQLKTSIVEVGGGRALNKSFSESLKENLKETNERESSLKEKMMKMKSALIDHCSQNGVKTQPPNSMSEVMDLSSERMIEELLVISAQIPKEKKPKQLKSEVEKAVKEEYKINQQLNRAVAETLKQEINEPQSQANILPSFGIDEKLVQLEVAASVTPIQASSVAEEMQEHVKKLAAVDSLMQTRSDVNKSLDGIADSVFEIAAENSIDLTSKHPRNFSLTDDKLQATIRAVNEALLSPLATGNSRAELNQLQSQLTSSIDRCSQLEQNTEEALASYSIVCLHEGISPINNNNISRSQFKDTIDENVQKLEEASKQLPTDLRLKIDEDIKEVKNRKTYLDDSVQILLDDIFATCEPQMTSREMEQLSAQVKECATVTSVASLLQSRSVELTPVQKKSLAKLISDENYLKAKVAESLGSNVASLLGKGDRIPVALIETLGQPHTIQAVSEAQATLMRIPMSSENSDRLSDIKSRSEELVEQMNELNTRIESAAIGIINSNEFLAQSPQLLTSLKSSHSPEEKLKMLLSATEEINLNNKERNELCKLIELMHLVDNEALKLKTDCDRETVNSIKQNAHLDGRSNKTSPIIEENFIESKKLNTIAQAVTPGKPASINKLPRDEVDSILGQSRVGDKLESSESSRKMQKENMLLNTRVLELQSVLEKTMNEGKKHFSDASKHDKLVRQLYNENAELAKRLVHIEKKSKQEGGERERLDEKHRALLKLFRQVCQAASSE
ncbi:cingulin-like [Symsagittifera roscoffensis]|uniref:cingulin-like n=1 Tax=Symsagittifera roscoffensis TaxID=84072 RepID=UPI00307B33F3